MQVAGVETVAIRITKGNVKLLYDVQDVPNSLHNLLSVGQSLNSCYMLLCLMMVVVSLVIKKSAHKLFGIAMAQNRMLSFRSVKCLKIVH